MFKTMLACGAVAVAVSTAMIGACVVRLDSEGYRAVEQRTFEVESDRSNVLLVTFDGSIEVRSWDRREISVEIVKRGSSKEFVDAIVILAESTDGNTTVEVRRPAELGSLLGLESDGSAAIVADVVASTGNGRIPARLGRRNCRTQQRRRPRERRGPRDRAPDRDRRRQHSSNRGPGWRRTGTCGPATAGSS